MSDPILSRRWLLCLFVLVTAVWFGTLDYRKLIKPDEGRYAEIAREMMVSGDWVTPRLNGIKYFEKPPLQYWTTAAAYEAFGQHEWTTRLWPALTGFAGLLLTLLVGTRLFGKDAAILATAILASSLIYLLIGHLNTLDMGLAFFMHLALSGFLMANQPGARPAAIRRWMLITWAALACAVLSKGLVAAVLAGGTLLVYSVVARDFSPWRRLELARGLPLFLLITAPWFVAVSLANPEFPRFFFIHEHVERFLTKTHHRYQPDWYFFAVFAVGALPWTGVMIHGLLARRPAEAPGFRTRWFLLVWVVLMFAFFSLSSSKLPSYILPLFPAVAWLVAEAALGFSRRALLLHLTLMALAAMAGLAVLPSITDYADAATPVSMMQAYGRWLNGGAILLLGGAVAALAMAWRGRRYGALMTVAAAALMANTLFTQGHEALGKSNSAYYIAGQVKPLLSPRVPFYSVDMYEQTLPFYLKRTLTLVDYTDEMLFGLEQEPHKWIPTMQQFTARWRRDADAFAVMRKDTYRNLAEQGLPMTVVAEDTRRIIVRKPAAP